MGGPVGFIGLGVMGRPMARNLLRAGIPLTVWSRTPEHCAEARDAGATVADSAAAVFRACRVVLLMLAGEAAMDEVLQRGRDAFADLVRDRVVVHAGTTSAAYSAALGTEITGAGGHYVEAPVSGSRVPAENGELIGMLAGPAEVLAEVRPVLAPMCREVVDCGAVPGALTMKIAVNHYLVTTVAALAEAVHLAQRLGLDLDVFTGILAAGQTASPISRLKAAKLRDRDFTVQAAVADVRKNSRLVADAARGAGAAAPIAVLADRLYAETVELGHGGEDMAAVVRALEARTATGQVADGQ